MGKEELLEAAQIAAGESVSFDDLYKKYKANPQDLAVQQELLLKAPSFLQAQDGIEADKWVTRIQKIYQNYVATKNPKELINANDYRIILTLEGDDNKEHKLGIVNMINSKYRRVDQSSWQGTSLLYCRSKRRFCRRLCKRSQHKV